MLNTQGEASLEVTPSLLACKSPLQDAVFFGHNIMHCLSRMQRWHIARLAPDQNSCKSREKVKERERAGCQGSGR